MFQNIGAQRGKTMCDETLPTCIFPLRMFQPIPDGQQNKAQDNERLSLAEAVTDIAELSQPGVGKVVSVNIVEGTDEPGERHIPFEQPDERKDESTDGEEEGCNRRESQERHENRSTRVSIRIQRSTMSAGWSKWPRFSLTHPTLARRNAPFRRQGRSGFSHYL
jgi:hypothetical protein